jgi:hypothetical protein
MPCNKCKLLYNQYNFVLILFNFANNAQGPKWGSQMGVLNGGVPNRSSESGSQIGSQKQGPKKWVLNQGPKSGFQIGVPDQGPKLGSQNGVSNQGSKGS